MENKNQRQQHSRQIRMNVNVSPALIYGKLVEFILRVRLHISIIRIICKKFAFWALGKFWRVNRQTYSKYILHEQNAMQNKMFSKLCACLTLR